MSTESGFSVPPAQGRHVQDRRAAFLWSLPQPIVVLGCMVGVATAAETGWADPGTLTGVVLVATIPLLWLCERWLPRRADWTLTGRELGEDVFWVGTIFLLWAPLFSEFYDTPISDAFIRLRKASTLPPVLDVHGAPALLAAAFTAAFASEFLYYWLHRLQHRSLLFWRIHATHHHITKMGVARADRTHPLELLALNLGPAIVLAFLGANEDVVAVFFVFSFVSGHLNHTNLPLRSGVWGWLFTTAEWHHLHHSLERDESDTNFGCTIILFDRLFGTFCGKRTVDRIGNGTGTPLSILTQLTIPFRSDDALRAL